VSPTPKTKLVKLTTSELRLIVAALDNHGRTLDRDIDMMRCEELAKNLLRAIRRNETAREILARWEDEEVKA
jgi:hypothetical protein